MLVLTQHFAPEVTAGRFRVQAFVDGLAARGIAVDTVCPVPNHPQGVIQKGYRGRAVMTRTVGGNRVTYLWVVTTRRKTPLTRLAYYGSYAAFATVVGSVSRPPTMVLASSPPLSAAAAGAMVAICHRVPLLLDIRDLWPHSPVAVGELSDGRLVSGLEQMERWLYSRADAIVTANDAFAHYIRGRAPADARVEPVPNGTTAEWLEAGAHEVSRTDVRLPHDRFVWAYAGNVGLAHGLEHAVDAARLLGDEYLLLIIGEGPKRAALETQIAATPTAVDIRPLMAPMEAARHLRAADAVLVSERQPMTVSAKLYDVCAIGRPIVAACHGELRRIVEREGIGLAVPHGAPEALAGALKRLREDPELRRRLAGRSREYARQNLRGRQAERLADLAESVAPGLGAVQG